MTEFDAVWRRCFCSETLKSFEGSSREKIQAQKNVKRKNVGAEVWELAASTKRETQ